MTSTFRCLRRLMLVVAALPILAGVLTPRLADAATRLFVAANELGQIWEIDPVTGNKITGFALIPPVPAARPGLAFDGTYLYYTDENLAVVQVYTTAGALDRTLPKPPGTEPGAGLGVSTTSLFLVDSSNLITAIDPFTGAVQTSYSIGGAGQALTFAGSRNSVFVVVNDSTIKELSPAGAELFSITAGEIFRGLAFSSSSNRLYGVRSGFLWAINPVTGAILPGYPVQIQDAGSALTLTKAGAAAADEPLLEVCGDGTVNASGETCDPPGPIANSSAICRQDCTFCGDGQPHAGEQCDDGNAVDTDGCRNDCTLPLCGDGTLDAGEACDDGNLVDGDGCSANCTIEPACGDGNLDQGELCDDGNTVDGDGCNANCTPPEICNDLIDNDGNGQIDCLDQVCDCLPIGRDPGAIRFGREGVGDLFAVHGSLNPASALNATTEPITFLLTNVNGEIFRVVIPAGDVKQIGRNLFRFKNKLAQRNRAGLARFDLRYYPRRNNFTFVVKAYGDLSKATVAAMAVQLVIGDDAFLNQSTWRTLPNGWLLTLPGE